MSYATVMAPCFTCGGLISFNPHKVPSLRDKSGTRHPVCRSCIEEANPVRAKNGLEPIVISEGAYEPINAAEL